jgi:hypothetical protein
MFFTRILPYFEDLFGDDTFEIGDDDDVCEADRVDCEAGFDEVEVLCFDDRFDDESSISISGGIERRKRSLFCMFFDIFLI